MNARLQRLANLRYALRPQPSRVQRRFVVFGQSRSGSTFLRTLLDAHPDVTCEDEHYRGFTPFPYAFHRIVSRRSRTPVWGFKLFVHHLERDQNIDPRVFMKHLHEEGYTILYLRRENLVRHALSQFLRRASGVTYQTRRAAPTRVTVDTQRFLDHLDERDYYWKRADAAVRDLPHQRISYERDLQPAEARLALMRSVFDRLGVAPVRVESELEQINTKRLRETVENYAELEAALRDTPFRAWLEAGEEGGADSS